MFWFRLWCLGVGGEGGFILFTGSYCGSLSDAWWITGSCGSDNRACLSSNVYGLTSKEMRVDD